MEKHKPSPPEEVKDAVVRDYLRGDKAIVIQMEYDISPGVMYRILSQRGVKLRRPDLAVKRSLKVPTKGPEETPPAPVAAEAPAGGLLAAMKALVAKEPPVEDVLEKVYDALAEWLPKEPIPTMVTIGLLDKSFTVENVIQAGMEAFVAEVIKTIPGVEEIEPGVWRLNKEAV